MAPRLPLHTSSPAVRPQIEATLARFGDGALRLAVAAGIRIEVLAGDERFRDRSLALRRLGAVETKFSTCTPFSKF